MLHPSDQQPSQLLRHCRGFTSPVSFCIVLCHFICRNLFTQSFRFKDQIALDIDVYSKVDEKKEIENKIEYIYFKSTHRQQKLSDCSLLSAFLLAELMHSLCRCFTYFSIFFDSH